MSREQGKVTGALEKVEKSEAVLVASLAREEPDVVEIVRHSPMHEMFVKKTVRLLKRVDFKIVPSPVLITLSCKYAVPVTIPIEEGFQGLRRRDGGASRTRI